jgi:hypothetical protein
MRQTHRNLLPLTSSNERISDPSLLSASHLKALLSPHSKRLSHKHTTHQLPMALKIWSYSFCAPILALIGGAAWLSRGFAAALDHLTALTGYPNTVSEEQWFAPQASRISPFLGCPKFHFVQEIVNLSTVKIFVSKRQCILHWAESVFLARSQSALLFASSCSDRKKQRHKHAAAVTPLLCGLSGQISWPRLRAEVLVHLQDHSSRGKSTTLWRSFCKRPSLRRLFRNCSSQGTNSSSEASPLDWHAMLGPWGLESRRCPHPIGPFRA